MKGFWNRIASWLKRLFKTSRRLFVLAWDDAKGAALERLNDEELQAAALDCVKAAAAKALTGDEAWADAYAAFREVAASSGKEWGRAVLEAILQNVYVVFKDGLETR